jgi:hypothetical protein
MDQSKATVLVVVFLSALALFVTAASIIILKGGRLFTRFPGLW